MVYGSDPLKSNTPAPDWHALFETFENYRRSILTGNLPINKIRSEISDACLKSADKHSNIVTLTVPTGGGKTFSSLRYALKYAEIFDCERIFYIIPYNTILDQNSRDIRKALDDYDGILEHHTNVVVEDENELFDYTRLTERWDSTIILTSLVKFLDSCYKGKNSDARRFPRLANSVLIFDEIQSLPKKCKMLFENAILFLTEYCGAQVVLCTATQPNLSFGDGRTIEEIMPNTSELFARLERVKYFPELGIHRTNQDAAVELAHILERKSVLAVVNTKITASDIYTLVKQILGERGLKVTIPDCSVSDRDIEAFASRFDDETILCVHLTTLLCPAHRLALIAWIKTFTRLGRRIFCISTALIEAGVNLSFPVVVRSLAGLTNIVQAAGRCNRNMEAEFGEVRIWDLIEEKLNRLEEIQIGQVCTRAIISNHEYERGLDHPATLRRYLEREKQQTESLIQNTIITSGKRKEVDFLRNEITYKVSGRYALFSDPINRMGGEKLSYFVPTYQAMKGITESIYAKPSILWVIDEIRVINPIRTESKNIRPISFDSPKNTLSVYTYLRDVEYEVRAHFIANPYRTEPDLIEDGKNENKHHNIAKRQVIKGGRRGNFTAVDHDETLKNDLTGGEFDGLDE